MHGSSWLYAMTTDIGVESNFCRSKMLCCFKQKVCWFTQQKNNNKQKTTHTTPQNNNNNKTKTNKKQTNKKRPLSHKLLSQSYKFPGSAKPNTQYSNTSRWASWCVAALRIWFGLVGGMYPKSLSICASLQSQEDHNSNITALTVYCIAANGEYLTFFPMD